MLDKNNNEERRQGRGPNAIASCAVFVSLRQRGSWNTFSSCLQQPRHFQDLCCLCLSQAVRVRGHIQQLSSAAKTLSGSVLSLSHSGSEGQGKHSAAVFSSQGTFRICAVCVSLRQRGSGKTFSRCLQQPRHFQDLVVEASSLSVGARGSNLTED